MDIIKRDKMKTRFITYLILLVIVFASCEKADSEEVYGYPLIYIPQATYSGGLNNDYYVPSGGGSYTYNFKYDSENNKMNVVLGVTRSGKESNKAYDVEVYDRPDTTQTIIKSGVITDAELLPKSMYQLPSVVEVDEGDNIASFYLSLDVVMLMDDIYNDKKLLLTVGIKNPTRYELLDKYSSVVVIIDVNDLRTYIE